jgi:hypothetical protein
MANLSDETIIQMLLSDNYRERENGTHAFIKKYETKVKHWVKKQALKIDSDDVWQEAASYMIFAIQSEKYQKYDSIELYTYFHWIVKSSWIKLAKHEKHRFPLSDKYDFNEQIHDEYKPDVYTELNQHKNFITECLEKFDSKTQHLLKEVILEDARLIDIFDDFGLINYNNAKQKYFKSKNTLINCLKKHLGYGK